MENHYRDDNSNIISITNDVNNNNNNNNKNNDLIGNDIDYNTIIM